MEEHNKDNEPNIDIGMKRKDPKREYRKILHIKV